MTTFAAKTEIPETEAGKSRGAKLDFNNRQNTLLNNPAPPSGLSIQRKAYCACGGSCPACQANSTGLLVSQPNDASEIEAERVAERVMRKSDGRAEAVKIKQEKPAHRKTIDGAFPKISRKNSRSSGSGVEGGAALLLSKSLSSHGQPLGAESRAFFEPRLGQSLENVRLHTDSASAQTAKALSAEAFTVGQNVYFGSGKYQPSTERGDKLLAHELVHTIQQTGGAPFVSRSFVPGVAAEDATEAEKIAEDEARGKGEELLHGEEPTTAAPADQNQTAQDQNSPGNTQTLCFAISELLSALTPAPRLFGAIAELIISNDYCRQMSCSPFLVPGSNGSDYFDSILGAPIYIAFLAHNNNLSAFDIARLAVASQISLNRPDILSHKAQRQEYYEIKPNSISGRAAGRLKLRNLASFYGNFPLPYSAGSVYTPTAEIKLASGMVGPFPLEIFLRLQRLQNGLIVYDICARGNLLGIGLSVVIAILIALIVILIGGDVELPLPIPTPELPAPVPVPVPAPVPVPVPVPA